MKAKAKELIEKVRKTLGEEAAKKAALKLRRAAREDDWRGVEPADMESHVSRAICQIEREIV